MKQPLVTIVILNWQQPTLTLSLLTDLEQLDYPNYRVVVVDNGSRDNSKSLLLDYIGHQSQLAKSGRLELMPLAQNVGFAEGNNRALERYRDQSEYFLLLNNDTRVTPNLLSELVAVFQSSADAENKIGLVSPIIHSLSAETDSVTAAKPSTKLPIWFAGGYFRFSRGGAQQTTIPTRLDEPYPTEFISGCALMISRQALESLHATPQKTLFNPDFFAYSEDAELCLRLQQLGYGLMVTPLTRVYHHLASSSGGPKSANFWYYNVRNNWLIVSRYGQPLERLGYWLYFWGYKPVLLSILGAIFRPRPDKPLRLKAIWQGWQDYRYGRFGLRQL